MFVDVYRYQKMLIIMYIYTVFHRWGYPSIDDEQGYPYFFGAMVDDRHGEIMVSGVINLLI